MPVYIQCSSCNRRLRVRDELTGHADVQPAHERPRQQSNERDEAHGEHRGDPVVALKESVPGH